MPDIVIVKNSIPFHLAETTVEAIEQARISLTDLARLLGYKDKDTLRQLAVRHAEKLAELGKTCTVQVKLKAGQGATRDFEEMAFNQPQVMFLVGKSDTPNASALLVQYVKAFFLLLNHVLAVEEYNRTTALVQQEQGIIVAPSLDAVAGDVQELKREVRVHTDAIKDLRGQLAELESPQQVLEEATSLEARARAITTQMAEVITTCEKALANKGAAAKAKKPKPIVVVTPTASTAQTDPPSATLAPSAPLYSISSWRSNHTPEHAPVANSSLGRAATALFIDKYGHKPPKTATEEINGARRAVGGYPATILNKAFKNTPRSKGKTVRR